MRISRKTYQQGRWIVDNLESEKSINKCLEHLTGKKKRQAGEALKTWVKLT
jgi:hypothetical protein